nr:PREDICTED: lysozyme C isoform X1 [Anolis carolinensis]|eukprot:XP_016851266.1 PREDICTED: lysozyme C isoform X1 [Anolis carolinensis]
MRNLQSMLKGRLGVRVGTFKCFHIEVNVTSFPSSQVAETMAPLLQTLLLLACFVEATQAKIFDRCQLAHVLKDNGLDAFEGISLADWICMAFFESGFDTEAIDWHNDGTKDYGIFHINSGWWCKDESLDSSSENLCSMNCKDLSDDDITDDINCAKRIVQDPQSMGAWNQWKMHCKDQDLFRWVKGCQL